MAISKNDIKKKNERRTPVADMVRFNEQKENKAELDVEEVAKVAEEQPVAEKKKEKPEKKEKKVSESIIPYKQVPDENKTVRKNIVLYPSLNKEIERIINLEKKKGNKKFSFNDLVNQVLIEYVNEYNKK